MDRKDIPDPHVKRTDEELMVRYQNGSEEAFQELYQRHSGRVYGYIRKKIFQPDLVDDAFQATWLKLHSFKERYDPAFPFLPWLFTLCKNVLIDEMRKLSTHPEIPTGAETFDNLPGLAVTPMLKPEIPSLNALSTPQRQALQYRYQEDLSFEEIAQKLETSPGNIRKIISRALAKLRGGSK